MFADSYLLKDVAMVFWSVGEKDRRVFMPPHPFLKSKTRHFFQYTAPQSEAQHFHLVYLPHISLKDKSSEPSLSLCFIERPGLVCYYLSVVF